MKEEINKAKNSSAEMMSKTGKALPTHSGGNQETQPTRQKLSLHILKHILKSTDIKTTT